MVLLNPILEIFLALKIVINSLNHLHRQTKEFLGHNRSTFNELWNSSNWSSCCVVNKKNFDYFWLLWTQFWLSTKQNNLVPRSMSCAKRTSRCFKSSIHALKWFWFPSNLQNQSQIAEIEIFCFSSLISAFQYLKLTWHIYHPRSDSFTSLILSSQIFFSVFVIEIRWFLVIMWCWMVNMVCVSTRSHAT